jgi:(S)-3,5-dihydroxyphenylglycine transaminase
MVELVRESLHASVTDPASASMNFLNEVASRFPAAISLAAGRPFDEFYAVEDVQRYLAAYVGHLRAQGLAEARVRQAILQYGRTNGLLGEMIARMLELDEDIRVPAESIMVTSGCQEAMIIALRGLCAGPEDVVLAAEPSYVGFTGAARVLGITVVPVPETPRGLRPETVARVAREVRAGGRRPRALYVVSNFANPSGVTLSAGVRRGLIEVAADQDLLILEDDPYGLFGLDDRRDPALKSLDTDHRVMYLGSFAKSVFPGARVGFLVADQAVVSADGRRSLLADELSTVKSMVTVNTSPIA